MTTISLAEYNPAAVRQQLHALLKVEAAAMAELSGSLRRSCPGIVISHDPAPGLLLAAFPEDGDRAVFLRTLVDVLDVYSGAPAGTAPELLETRLVAVLDTNSPAPQFSSHFRLVTDSADACPGEPGLLLEYGTSFGSGRHPSTRLAMAALDRLAEGGTVFPFRVLDVGCGSGILALACGMLGAQEVLGIDIDSGAVAVAVNNAKVNQLAGQVSFSAQSLAQLAGPYDLLVANVTGAVMSGMVADFVRLVGPGGWLVLSGLQGRQLAEMVGVFDAQGFAQVAQFSEDPWRSGLLRMRE